MKNVSLIAIAAAVLLSLASCQKEESKDIESDSIKTERIITGLYANDCTKTTLDTDGITPRWSVGDKIRVLDGTGYQDITLAAGNITDGGRKITFTTTLTGMQLYAVYPASATTMTSCIDGNVTFTIPTVQDGTFGSANICVASGDGTTGNSLYFRNATAIVEMTVATGVMYTNLAAANKIAGDMTVTLVEKGFISNPTTTSLSSKSIFVVGTPSNSKFYLTVAPVTTGEVTITCNTSDKSGSTDKGTKALAMDKIYEMNLSGMSINHTVPSLTINPKDLTGLHGIQKGHEYVLIKATYNNTDSTYLKWATDNLAVTDSGKAKWNGTNYVIGDYFQWAASYDGYGITEGASKIPTNLVLYEWFINKFSKDSTNYFAFTPDKRFTKAYSPYYNSNSFSYTKYTSVPANLEQSDDVANIVLGGIWCMPTGGGNGQFNQMRKATYWAWDATDKGYYVFKPGVGTSGAANGRGDIAGTDDKTKALLFFPSAGFGRGSLMYINEVGTQGIYLSCSLRSLLSNTDYWWSLNFTSSEIYINHMSACGSREEGCSVRPVSE